MLDVYLRDEKYGNLELESAFKNHTTNQTVENKNE